MATLSRSEIIKANPIGEGLNTFRHLCKSTQTELGIPNLSDAVLHIVEKNINNLVRDLILPFQIFPASRLLPSKTQHGTLLDDIDRFAPSITSRTYDVQRTIALCQRVVERAPDTEIWNAVYDLATESTPPPRPLPYPFQTPWTRNTSSFANSSEHRKYVDDVMKEELGPLYVGVPGFYEAFFGGVPGLEAAARAVFEKCQEGDNPQYSEGSGWRDWPESAKEKEVLGWLVKLIDLFADLAEEHGSTPTTRRRLFARPNQPLQGSTAERKLDVGFVDDPNAREDSKCHWSEILVPGELKSNPGFDISSKAWLDLGRYAREVLAAQDTRRFVLGFTLCGPTMRLWEFDRVGGIASSQFNINKDGLQFLSAVLGYLWMDEAQLGFDPTILSSDGKRYIEIVRNDERERLVIDKFIKRAPCIAGRATTCWRAHREGDEALMPLVIKDTWQYTEREEEGELLREAREKGVVNVARYYYHETVQVGGEDDDIRDNVRKGLDITGATNYKPEGSMMPPTTSGVHGRTRKARSTSSTARKRSSSYANASLPPSKRTCSSSPTKNGVNRAMQNRVHRRVIVRDYGKAIYKASSRTAMLAALEGCIEGYQSLHTQAGMLQRDVSIGNLMMNEDDSNPSSRSFIIDLDLAIKEQREGVSGARGKTGTRAFMAIGVLLDEKHSFMHDLESFFWVLFWICIHYDGPDKDIGPTEFECWNYENDRKLAKLKFGTIGDERDFLKTVEENFTTFYQPLIPYVNKLRRAVFPGGGRWKKPNPQLYSEMKNILRAAQEKLEGS